MAGAPKWRMTWSAEMAYGMNPNDPLFMAMNAGQQQPPLGAPGLPGPPQQVPMGPQAGAAPGAPQAFDPSALLALNAQQGQQAKIAQQLRLANTLRAQAPDMML